jgi:hypothetical protein
MKIRVHFTTNNGEEAYTEYTSSIPLVLNDAVKEQLLERFWFEHGEVAVDGIEEII